jgi:hypothetical protein
VSARGCETSAPHDQRTASTYIFGAICPGDGKGAALVLPACNTEAMNLHVAEIAAEVAPGKHAVLVVDQAEWHAANVVLIEVKSQLETGKPGVAIAREVDKLAEKTRLPMIKAQMRSPPVAPARVRVRVSSPSGQVFFRVKTQLFL